MTTSDPMMLICDMGDRRVALAVADVIEVAPVVPLWRPPGLPRPLAGFATIRGRAVPVLAPALLFDGAATLERIGLYAHLVHVRDGDGGSLCLLVDRAAGIVAVDPGTMRLVAADLSQRGCVTGEVTVDDRAVAVLALDRLLADGERVRIAALAAEAARRAGEWAA